MSEIRLNGAVPVLAVEDLAKSVEFWERNLGFEKAFEFGPYAGVQRGPVEIHLSGAADSWSSAPNTCRIDVQGVDALYAEIEPRGIVKPDETLQTTSFGMRQFSVLDPSGNRITFAEPV